MPGWAQIAAIVTVAFWLRGLVYLALWVKVRRFKGRMWRYWRGELTFGQVGGRKNELVRLFQLARVEDAGLTHYEPTPGQRHVAVHSSSVFRNVFERRGDVQQLVNDFLVESEGYFRHETLRSFVPLYWPSVFLKFPEDVFVYADLQPSGALLRAAQAAWTVAVALGVFGVQRTVT